MSFLLLTDGSSKLLLANGTDRLLLDAAATVTDKSDTDSATLSESAAITTLSLVADTDSFTLSDTGAITTSSSVADTDTFTATDTESILPTTFKVDTDSFTLSDTAALGIRTNFVATDRFLATEHSFLNYTPAPPLAIKFTGHRVYGELADADNLSDPPLPTRTFRMPTTTEDLDFYLLDENQDIVDPSALTMTFDVGTPGVRVEGTSGDITAEYGTGSIVWVTIPGGLNPGVYSCRLTVNTGTVESPVYRSYPTEPITLIVED